MLRICVGAARRLCLLLLPALLLAPLLLAGTALAQQGGQVRIRNAARVAVFELYLSPAGSNAWGADLLGSEVLAGGGQVQLRLPGGQCVQDIRVVFENGRSEQRRAVNLCQVAELLVGDPAARADADDVAGRGRGSAQSFAPGAAPPSRGIGPGAPSIQAPPPMAMAPAPRPPPPAAATATGPLRTTMAAPVPVYNLLLDGPGGPSAQVQRNRATQATFFVGPPEQASQLRDAATGQLNPEARFNAAQDASLLVTFECSWCAEQGMQTRRITWRAAAFRSDDAVFSFVARPGAAPTPEEPLALHFYVTGLGESFRHLVLPVTLVDQPAPAVPQLNLAQAPGAAAAPAATSETPSEDVLLRITGPEGGFTLATNFSPAFLAKASAADLAVLQAAGQAATPYKLGFADRQVLEALANRIYVRLRALTFGDVADRDAPVIAHSSPFLNADDFGKAVGSLCDLGNELYSLLFRDPDADPAVAALLRAIERTGAAGRFTLHVQSRGLYLPWQLLHPNCQESAPQLAFWGLRWEISSQPLERERPGGSLAAIPVAGASPTLYGRYSDDSDTGRDARQVLAGAQTLNDVIKRVMGDAQVARTRNAFLRNVQEQRADYRLIWTYTHADGGLHDQVGQRLIFGTNNDVLPADLDRVWRGVVSAGGEGPVMPRRPLVVLLGCETGVSPGSPFSGRSLAGQFLKMGASGVVVTESRVWAEATVEFGTKLAELLQAGGKVPATLRAMRADWMQRGNPYGLVFTFYGHPLASLN